VAVHDLQTERRTLHGHFSLDLEPVLTIDPGDTVRFSTLDAGWGIGAPPPGKTLSERPRFQPWDPELDAGHPLLGPIEVRGASAGQTLAVEIGELVVGSFGVTDAGGWPSFLNDRLGVADGETFTLDWSLDAEAGIGRDQRGRTVRLAPFLGVLGMPPPEPGVHPTAPPRASGGNIDCRELVTGSTLYLPIPVDGCRFSAGDGHARQGDGEVSCLAIECPFDRAELTLGVRDDLPLETPIAETPAGWVTLGFDADLDEAMAVAVGAMLDLMERELGVGRKEALALASVVVDLRITQVVNGVQGVHAVLARDAIGVGENPR
jgi:acetamidase/formamidase